MPGSRASVFGEAEDFQAALSADGVAGLLVTSRGQFRARLTQLTLDGWRLATVEEEQPRIAFVAVPAGMVLVSFPIGTTICCARKSSRICGPCPRFWTLEQARAFCLI